MGNGKTISLKLSRVITASPCFLSKSLPNFAKTLLKLNPIDTVNPSSLNTLL